MKLVDRQAVLDYNELYAGWIDLSIAMPAEDYVHWIPLEDAMMDLRQHFGISLGGLI